MDTHRILVVEDDQIVAAGLRRNLLKMGYEVPEPAISGEAAIEAAERLRPDLVVMDIRLQGPMDGIAAAAHIRRRCGIPVVFLSAYSNQEVVERAKVTEPYGYILKPYEARELQVVVETALYKHRMEQALQERELWLSAVLTSIGDGVIVTDGSGRITYLNPEAERLTGWPDGEAHGKSLEEVFHLIDEETRQPIEPPLATAIREARRVPMANHSVLVSRTGKLETPIEDCATPMASAGRPVRGGVMVFRDVSEQRHAEEQTQQAWRFNQSVLDTLPVQIAVLDADGSIVAVNRAWTEFAAENQGAPMQTGVGANYLQACEQASGPGAKEARAAAAGIRAVLEGAATQFALEYPCHAPTEERWFMLQALPLDHPSGRVVTVHQNITDRKRAERASSELAAIVESAEDAIIGTSLNGVVTSWNGGAERLSGYSAATMIGQPLARLFHSESADEMRVNLERARAGARMPAFETVWQRKDASTVQVLVSVSPVLDPKGQVTGVAAIGRDISQVKRLEQQYQQAQKMEAIGRLAGGVAHDFNNLLTVINGYSQVLLGLLNHQPKAVEMIQEIHQAGERAAGLTQQLLAYSRKQMLQPKVLDINGAVADAQKMLARMIGEDVELTLTLADDVHQVKADPGQLGQVLLNLCVNARDAMPTGGKITIETRNVDFSEIEIADVLDVRPGQYVLLAVSDTGVGMDTETQTHLFEPFFTTKGLGAGTGLGLATVYGIIKQSGGYIKVYSELGHGTTFKIYFPAIEEETEGGTAPATATPGGTETILLVEDEEAVRALARLMLQISGYHVLVAASGFEALQVAAAHRGQIDLLVTDVVMPGMSGRQVAEALRRSNPSLQVLFMSGYTDDAVVRHGVLEAETAFLQKPFTMHDLTCKIREVLDQPA